MGEGGMDCGRTVSRHHFDIKWGGAINNYDETIETATTNGLLALQLGGPLFGLKTSIYSASRRRGGLCEVDQRPD